MHVLLAVAVQFQESTYRVKEGEVKELTVILVAMKAHDFDFVVNVRIRNGTAERMLIP